MTGIQKEELKIHTAFRSMFFSIVDIADHSAFDLPNFATKTKNDSDALKTRPTDLIDHQHKRLRHLFTFTEELETGPNHVIESIYRYINSKATTTVLPPTLYFQFDNCTRENKNRYMFLGLESLSSCRIFKEVQVSYLPLGYIHEEIDQAFSTTSERLKSEDACTLS